MTAHAVTRGWASVQAFRSIRAANRGLIAAPWTPASPFLCSRNRKARLSSAVLGVGPWFLFFSLTQGVLR
jgi:hypothetical protein